MKVSWKGVIPAITTPFNADLTVDEGFLAKHSRWLVDEGSVGLVPIGSLGESATLSPGEKRMDTVVKFVQLIKLVQQRVGMGSDRVRPPRLQLSGEELREATTVIDRALATRPQLKAEVSRNAAAKVPTY